MLNEVKSLLKNNLVLPQDLIELIGKAKSVLVAKTIEDLYGFALAKDKDEQSVSYEVKGKRLVQEVLVHRVKNGIAANYCETYMRRRDPDSMLIGDDSPTDKVRYKDVYKKDFTELRQDTFDWLQEQDILIFAFMAGHSEYGIPSFVIAPANAGFFAFGLGLLQGIIDIEKTEKFTPQNFIFVAPPFRHTHFNGKQIVVHNRLPDRYEIFSYNLYPGPSAKKGVYGTLLHFGEQEGWVTAHASVAQVITPYDNRITIMHEGASGGGKSEMNEHIHREYDGTIAFGHNIKTDEKSYLLIPRGCNIHPVADDMVLCHSKIQKGNGKLTVLDAESGWFIRVDHIKNYGTDPDIEARSIHPQVPLLFLNIESQPGSTALLWDHIEDSPGKSCPNPRFILPRQIVPDVVSKPVSVDIRSFGVRTPPCTKDDPSYGILGLFHVLPPALAWLWRLVSPRGFANPSIIEKEGMASEGVGSYWPFATGLKVNQANLLLRQIADSPNVKYVLCPVKHIGAWEVGFMPQWIMREYVARRGGIKFTKEELTASRCPILGYSLEKLMVEGQRFEKGLLKVEYQADVGFDAYDKGAKELTDFFKKEAKQYYTKDLDKLGRDIIDCLVNNGSMEDYRRLIMTDNFFVEE